jgi:hypothetical protein
VDVNPRERAQRTRSPTPKQDRAAEMGTRQVGVPEGTEYLTTGAPSSTIVRLTRRKWSRRRSVHRHEREIDGRVGHELSACCCQPERRCDVGGEFVVVAAKVLHERMPGGDACRRAETFEPTHRPQPSLQPTMSSLDPVVAVLLGRVHRIRDEPPVTGRVPKRAGGHRRTAGEPLHPPVHRDLVDGDTPFGQQLLEIAVRQPVPRYQRTATVITPGGNRNPANADRSTDRRTARGRRTRPASSAGPDHHRPGSAQRNSPGQARVEVPGGTSGRSYWPQAGSGWTRPATGGPTPGMRPRTVHRPATDRPESHAASRSRMATASAWTARSTSR